MAFRWRAVDGPLLVLFESSLPSQKKREKKTLSELDLLWQNFVDLRMVKTSFVCLEGTEIFSYGYFFSFSQSLSQTTGTTLLSRANDTIKYVTIQNNTVYCFISSYLRHLQNTFKGAQWLSGRVLDSRPKGRGFEPHRRHCVVSLSKNINPSLVLVQTRNTRPFITERLLMGRKESNQTKQNKILS